VPESGLLRSGPPDANVGHRVRLIAARFDGKSSPVHGTHWCPTSKFPPLTLSMRSRREAGGIGPIPRRWSVPVGCSLNQVDGVGPSRTPTPLNRLIGGHAGARCIDWVVVGKLDAVARLAAPSRKAGVSVPQSDSHRRQEFSFKLVLRPPPLGRTIDPSDCRRELPRVERQLGSPGHPDDKPRFHRASAGRAGTARAGIGTKGHSRFWMPTDPGN